MLLMSISMGVLFAITYMLWVRGRDATPSLGRRQERRYTVGQPVQAVILCDPEICCEGRIRDISNHGLQLRLPVRPEIGAAIRLSLPARDALVLGEVRYCVSLENEFLIGVQLDQMLTNLTELVNLNQEFCWAGTR